MEGVPRSFSFHSERPLLYFIGQRPQDQYSSLFFVSLNDQGNEEEWNPLIGSGDVSEHQMTKEELLLRERMRTTGFGITSYSFHSQTDTFLVPSSGKLFTINVSDHVTGCEVVPREITTALKGARMDEKMNPNDPSLVSFISNGDIWLTDVNTGNERRLTYSRGDGDDETKTSGVAEFIMQEEFDRYTGYWWQRYTPDTSSRFCRILYLEVDESEVEVFYIPDAVSIKGKPDPFRYPLAGAKNAQSSLCLVEFDGNNFEDAQPVVKRLYPTLGQRFNDYEYVVRAGWTIPTLQNEQQAWVQVLDRKQQRLRFVHIPLSEFKVESERSGEKGNDDPVPSVENVVFEDVTETWINVTDIVHYLADGRIIWASETETGFRHLYLIDLSLPNVRRTLTTGEWQVNTSDIFVDEKRELIYFEGTKDSPIETHLYVVSYANCSDPNVVHRLTEVGYSHNNFAFSKSFTHFATVSSNLRTKSSASVYEIRWPEDNANKEKHVFEEPTLHKVTRIAVYPSDGSEPTTQYPQLFSFTNSIDKTAHGLYFTPPDFDPEKKYPTLLYVYGGPHVQLVKNSYATTYNNKRFQNLVSEGFVVVIIDGIGSWNRGLFWEGQLRLKMGQVEVEDQMLGLKTLSFVDHDRIAVTGWSYGGYLSLMFLAQRPDFFKIGIAGGPVTLWEAYDSGYTERYMDTPGNNPDGYRLGSLKAYINGFPKEKNRLLIAHGLMDENVHFCHTAQLINWLVEVGAPYQLQVFPSERHGLRTPNTYKHWANTWTAFLKEHL